MSLTSDGDCNCEDIKMTKDQAKEILELDVRKNKIEAEFHYKEWSSLVNRAAHYLVEDLMGINK